ncbi:SagB family peptide dehydrogenase [Lentzea sp. E54]|uniref:SagB family peptide dehydrogenase n=1 Tax=Lentzea xerophila TaxID=3435883 RepID=UPI003DA68A9A
MTAAVRESVGTWFWRRTFEDVQALFAEGHGEEGGADDPLTATVFRGLSRQALAAPGRVIGDGPLVSTLLHFGYGLNRVELGPHAVWPYHRTVASARCFHPIEVYVWIADDSEVPAGGYHFDVAHHSLVRLRTGAPPAELGTPGAVTVVAAARFRKTAFRYRDYAYRIAAQEAGLTIGNLLLVGAALGLEGVVRHRFDDDAVNRVFGLDGEEETAFAILSLGAPVPVRAEPLEPIAPEPLELNASPAAHWAGLLAVDRASRLGPEPVESLAPNDFHLPVPGGEPVVLPAARVADLASALRVRDSGGRMFGPAKRPTTAAELGSALRDALSPLESDHTGGVLAPLVDCHVLAQHVVDVPPGLYRLTPGMRLVPEEPGTVPWRRVIGMFCDRTPSVDAARAAAVVLLTVDREAAERALGARGYRISHQEAGIVAQRISVAAAAAGLSARITNGYDCEVVRAALGHDPARVAVFALLLGRRAPSAQYEPLLVW